MQTPHPPASVTLAPVSPALAALIHQVQAEAVAAATPAPLPEGAIVVLPRPADVRVRNAYHRESNGYRSLTAYFADGTELQLQTCCCTDPEYKSLAAGIWYGSHSLLDTAGREWTSRFRTQFVIDEFGTLVPVGGAA